MKAYLLTISLLIIFIAWAQVENDYISKGNDYYRQGSYQLAEVQYRQALKLAPESETAKYNLANSLYKQKKYQEAQELYDQLSQSKDDPRRSASYYNTGVAYSAQKELESSIDAYKEALRINPDDREARENLQKALSELKQQQNEQNNSRSQSNMSSGAADQKLKELEQKEREVQNRLQNQKKGEGGTSGKDW